MPKVGDVAPDFTLPSANGDVNLYKLLEANKAVVLFFYPKDETPGCTKEACAFRDAYQQFKGDGVEVVGISSDSVESHGKFAEHHKLPFVILSDAKGEIRKLYDVGKSLFIIPGRTTFVIDREHKVRLLFSSQMNAEQHVQEALNILREIKA
eukprot:TRINITY_DN1913_c0_g1_i2.p1 TRINITY_DN1913_c0_g1~~TRINITY_DN1913_c0_g1_i2.p1  ORF type:complete len:152 (-),score=37.06 TRINITY_DN1913_c0_g1_i2:69-524(-)